MAGILGANLGLVILLEILVSIPVTVISIIAGRIFCKKYPYLPEIDDANKVLNETKEKLPSPLMSFLPILLPIFLMLLRAVALLGSAPLGKGTLCAAVDDLGQTIVALVIGLIIAFFTYKSVHPDDKSVWTFDGLFGEALKTARQIVLIVGAMGAFATVLKLSNLQEIVMNVFSGVSIGIIVPIYYWSYFQNCYRVRNSGNDNCCFNAFATC